MPLDNRFDLAFSRYVEQFNSVMGTCMFLDFIQSSVHMACVLAEILTVIIYAALKLIWNSTCLLINVGVLLEITESKIEHIISLSMVKLSLNMPVIWINYWLFTLNFWHIVKCWSLIEKCVLPESLPVILTQLALSFVTKGFISVSLCLFHFRHVCT